MKVQIVTSLTSQHKIITVENADAQLAALAPNESLPVFVAVRVAKNGRVSDSHVMVRENYGYIFRSVSGKSGHSGHSPTITLAIEKVLDLNAWSVFSFDNIIEALHEGYIQPESNS